MTIVELTGANLSVAGRVLPMLVSRSSLTVTPTIEERQGDQLTLDRRARAAVAVDLVHVACAREPLPTAGPGLVELRGDGRTYAFPADSVTVRETERHAGLTWYEVQAKAEETDQLVRKER